MMQRILSGGKTIIPQINKFPQKSQQCRKLSGHGHGAGAHHGPVGNKLDPYPMKHHQTQPNEAYLFGIKPGDKLEGWEIPVYGVYFICTIICVVGIGYCKDDDSLTGWARREAIAREKVIENGGTIEFGKWYQYPKYTAEGIDIMPVMAEEEE